MCNVVHIMLYIIVEFRDLRNVQENFWKICEKFVLERYLIMSVILAFSEINEGCRDGG